MAANPPVSFVTDAPFELGELVAAAERPVVLVVPFFDWEHLSANGMAFDGKKHRLGIPKNLNGVVAEVLAQVGQHRGGSAPGLAQLILAGHSRAYDFLNPLAASYADPQMSTGALAKLERRATRGQHCGGSALRCPSKAAARASRGASVSGGADPPAAQDRRRIRGGRCHACSRGCFVVSGSTRGVRVE